MLFWGIKLGQFDMYFGQLSSYSAAFRGANVARSSTLFPTDTLPSPIPEHCLSVASENLSL
jgi:hypothetical protein